MLPSRRSKSYLWKKYVNIRQANLFKRTAAAMTDTVSPETFASDGHQADPPPTRSFVAPISNVLPLWKAEQPHISLPPELALLLPLRLRQEPHKLRQLLSNQQCRHMPRLSDCTLKCLIKSTSQLLTARKQHLHSLLLDYNPSTIYRHNFNCHIHHYDPSYRRGCHRSILRARQLCLRSSFQPQQQPS